MAKSNTHTCPKAISGSFSVFAVSVAPVPLAVYIGGSYVRLRAAPIKEKQYQVEKGNFFLFSFRHIFYHTFVQCYFYASDFSLL